MIRERLVKERQYITIIALFPFALATDIVLSPIYLVGGTAIMLYVGSVGHK